MMVDYLQRLQNTSFVSITEATFVVKPVTVVVLLMLAIKYNDDYSPNTTEFYDDAMMNLSLEQNGKQFTAPQFTNSEWQDYTLKYP